MNISGLHKGAIYCRVSTDEQEAHGTSLQSQEEKNKAFAKENNLNIPKNYIFLEQFSGGYFERPKLARLLELAENKEIDFIIFTKRDRIAREQYVYQKIIKILKENNVKILFSIETLTGDEAMDNLMGGTFMQFAEWEREQIKQRTYAGKRQHAKNNKWIFSHIPFGYKKNHHTKELEIYEEEKQIVEKIVDYFLYDGGTLSGIAKKFTNEKILCPAVLLNIKKGGSINDEIFAERKNSIYHWNIGNIHNILKRAELYSGSYQAFTKQYKQEGKKSIFIGERPKQDWITVKVPAIITEKQAKEIQEKLEHNRKYAKKRAKRIYMLQGKLFCDCESPELHNFNGYYHNQKNKRNYRCGLYNTSKFSADRICKNHISGLKIEPIVIKTLKELFTDTEYIFAKAVDEYYGNNNKQKRDDKQVERYNRLYTEILEIDNKRERSVELYVDGLISKEKLTDLKAKLEAKEIELKREFSKEHEILKSEIFRETSEKGLKEIVENLQEQIESFFDSASYEDLKELVNIVVDKIIVPKDTEKPIQIIMKIPGGNVSFEEKYREDEFVEFTDEQGKTHNICETGRKIPKLLELDGTKKPYKYRSIAFKEDGESENTSNSNDDNSSNSGGTQQGYDYKNYEGRFLDFLKERFYQFGGCDH